MISTEKSMHPELLNRLKDLQGEPVASDARHALYDELKPMTGHDGSILARAQGEPVTVTLLNLDEIVTFDDGRQFQATESGWRRVDAERVKPTTTDTMGPDVVKTSITLPDEPIGDTLTIEGDPDHV